ncbi:hypothetical protein K491DRAFT_694182 [Lophiostoma macrostomum CBS 122681]|uniref:RING-type domain-containing protein n=1 Tax=Lophiostoma macrostomum CBS 122681 TaxID=1314788 RepID=A0A6A6T2R5_9PLEO|nr:hypothetical protein K491DRAFT_694182 [Lophiostoma macrostomum CBS 122681]
MAYATAPSQDQYLADCLIPLAPILSLKAGPTQCTICLCDLRHSSSVSPVDNVVNIKPCHHKFHRDCITLWFTGTHQQIYTCPNCRTTLFTPNRLTPTQIESMTLSSSSDLISEAILEPAESYTTRNERFSIRLADRHPRDIFIPRFLARDTTKLQQLIDFGIYLEQERFDICGLHWDWKACVSLISLKYEEAGYPQTDFVTQTSLLLLLVAAALIDRLGNMARYNNTVEFAQLLAYGEKLFLETQREARECEAALSFSDYRREDSLAMLEYKRVLDHRDDGYRTPGLWHVKGHEERIRWIVGLRMRIWGRGVEPLGPRVL